MVRKFFVKGGIRVFEIFPKREVAEFLINREGLVK